jgi:catechol 2,3-dioxygenase-like lactoylglutathione lyase family enzyme
LPNDALHAGLVEDLDAEVARFRELASGIAARDDVVGFLRHAARDRRAGRFEQRLGLVALVVRDYEEALDFFVGTLGFTLVEDRPVPEQAKRWVVVAPPGSGGAHLLLARASSVEQETRIGNQTGGRVFLFLHTDDFQRDYRDLTARGVRFVRPPKEESYGTVAVFEDLYGNLWDLLQLRNQS